MPPLVAPLWVAAWIAPELRRAVEPTLRTDLATTPTDAEGYLKRALRTRMFAAHIPAAIGAVVVALILGDTMINGIGSGGHYDAIGQIISLAGFFAGLAMMIGDRAVMQSLWESALKSCVLGVEMKTALAIPTALARAVGAILFAGVLVWVVPMAVDSMISSSRRTEQVLFVTSGLAVTFVYLALAQIRERRAWRRFVAGFLDMDPVIVSRGKSQ